MFRFSLLFFVLLYHNVNTKTQIYRQDKVYIIKEHLSAQELYEILSFLNVPYALNFVAVARTESGYNLDSELANNGNNLFGMGCAEGRKNMSIGCYFGHSKFKNHFDSCVDLKIWCDIAPPKNGEDFYEFMKRRNYNPNQSYYQYLKKIDLSDIIVYGS